MTTRMARIGLAAVMCAAAVIGTGSGGLAQGARTPVKASSAAARPSPGAGPIIVMETAKGLIEWETYPDEAPKSIEQILRLIKRSFYNGQRILRVEPGFVVQFGDPQTRDMTKREWWGRGFGSGSGKIIGVAEFSKKRTHVRGAVSLAHAGDAAKADSQIFICLAPQPKLDLKHVVVGKVLVGMDVAGKLQVTDLIKKVTIRTASGEGS